MAPEKSIQPTEPVTASALADVSRVGSLEIDLDTKFQQTEWRIERVGWGIIAFVVVAALLGVFSVGPLSKTVTGTPSGGIQVKYDRFARRMAPIMLEVALEKSASQDGKARIWFSRRYIERFELVRITPEPVRAEAGAERVIYTFAVADPAEPTGVTLYLRSEETGAFRGSVGREGGESFALRQFIYP